MKQLIDYAWYNPGATTHVICLVLYLVGGRFKAVLASAPPSAMEIDVQHAMDWGAQFPLKHAIQIISEDGTVENKQLLEEAAMLHKVELPVH